MVLVLFLHRHMNKHTRTRTATPAILLTTLPIMTGVGVAGVLSLDPELPSAVDVAAPDSVAVLPPGTNPPARPADVGISDSLEYHDVGIDVVDESLDEGELSDVR